MNNNQVVNVFLWEKAKARASFPKHLIMYMVMSAFFILLWFYTDYKSTSNVLEFWPIYPIIWRWLGIIWHYIKAYGSWHSNAQKEYEKLLSEQNIDQIANDAAEIATKSLHKSK